MSDGLKGDVRKLRPLTFPGKLLDLRKEIFLRVAAELLLEHSQLTYTNYLVLTKCS